MSFQHLFDFLDRLQANNRKEWMDDHRKEYIAVGDYFIQWLNHMNECLAKLDPNYFDTPGKKAINRINNNLLFHPNRPVYKDHFGAGLDQVSKQGDFYIELGVRECFLGGGYWYPDSRLLRSIREAIDYNGQELQAVIDSESFRKRFGGLIDGGSLSRPPKGFSADHPHINLLKLKSFAAGVHLPREACFKNGFDDLVANIYTDLLPFRRYLNEAVSV